MIDAIEVHVTGKNYADLYARALKLGRQYFEAEDRNLRVMPFTAHPEETLPHFEGQDSLIHWEADVIVGWVQT